MIVKFKSPLETLKDTLSEIQVEIIRERNNECGVDEKTRNNNLEHLQQRRMEYLLMINRIKSTQRME
jgi:hypothetical protein